MKRNYKCLYSAVISFVFLFSVIISESASASLYARISVSCDGFSSYGIQAKKTYLYNDINKTEITATNKTGNYFLTACRKHTNPGINLTPDIYYHNQNAANIFPKPVNYRYVSEVRINPGDKIIRYIHDQDGEKDGALL